MSFTRDLTRGIKSWDRKLRAFGYFVADLEAAIAQVDNEELGYELATLLEEFCNDADVEYQALEEELEETRDLLEDATAINEELEREIEPDYIKRGLTGDEPMLSKEAE